jgi:outer membrane protein TolC
MKHTKPFQLTILFVAALFSAKAQSIVLQQYIDEGLKNNLQLKQEILGYERSLEDLKIAHALFFPQVTASSAYTWSQGGRKINFPVGDLLNPVYSTLNQLTSSKSFPQIENVNTQFLPNDFHDTKLRFFQPIFNTDIYYAYKAQKELISVKNAQRKAYENELKFSIASAYYQFLESAQAVKIFEKTSTVLKELYEVNQSLVKNNKATADVISNASLELSKTDKELANAARNYHSLKAYFNFLLNRDSNVEIQIDSTLNSYLKKEYELDSLTNLALANRQEIQQVKSGMAANEYLVSLSRKNAALPNVSVVGDLGAQGNQYRFNSDQRYWLVQFSLSWDIFTGGKKQAKTQQAKLDYQIADTKYQQLKKQIELQVIQSYYDLEAAQKSYSSSQSAVKNAERSFKIIKAKYSEGQAILLEFLQAQNNVTNAQLSLSISTYELLRKEAELQKTIAIL